MTPTEFFASFDTVAAASGGVEKLRKLALHLAFQGRFTATNRPLVRAVVLDSMAPMAEARGRAASTDIRAGSTALAVGPAEMLIPEGWEWVPLMTVARLESGHTPSRNHANYWDGGIAWLGIRDARKHDGKVIFETIQTVSQLGIDNSSARVLPEGTVCLSRTASVGYVTIMGRPMATSQDFVNWVCSDRLTPQFLMHLLACENDTLLAFSKGAVHQTIYFPEIKAFYIALPPLDEQKRIVAKVDQLMALCDDLEARQAKKRETAVRLNRAALDALTNAEGPEEVAANFRRIAENFETLVYAPESVEQLRTAVLELATLGRLVPQESTEFPLPADVSISSEVIGSALLPNGWARNALHQVADMRLGKMLDQHKNRGKAHPYLRNTNVHWLRFELDDIKEMPFGDDELAEYEVVPGDVMVCEGGHGIGRAAVWAGQVKSIMFQKALHRIRPGECLDGHYLAYYIKAASNRGELQRHFTGSGILHLTGRGLALLEMRLPPLAEQKRIVAKVDQLMALCDTLEAALRRAEATAQKLAEAVVAEIVA